MKNDATKTCTKCGEEKPTEGATVPPRKRGEHKDAYERRIDDWKIDQACKKTGMEGVRGKRNKKWRIAEAERKLSMNTDEIW